MAFSFQVSGNSEKVGLLVQEIQRLCTALELAFNENETLVLEELHVEPEKLQAGRLYFADGSDWDPGSGRGVYCWDATGPTWRLLG